MNNSAQHRALTITAWIAVVFSLLVCGGLVYQHFSAATNDPWKSPQLLALRLRLAAEPNNETLLKDIRQLDLKFRQNFRRRLDLDKMAGWMLLGGGLVFVVTASRALALKKKLPSLRAKKSADDEFARLASRARWSLACVSIVIVSSLLIIRLGNSSVLPTNDKGWQKLLGKSGKSIEPIETAASLTEFKSNWPRFRGWDGGGSSEWKSETPPAVLWHSAIPSPGQSSPIVWGNRVFISGGTALRCEVFCYNTSSGALLWRQPIENVPGSPPEIPVAPEDTGYAASTMATDGRRVYAIFANGDLGALDFDGDVVWSRYLGPVKNSYGYATSLAIWGSNLIVQLDSGDSDPKGSKLISIQGATGHVLWERSRPVPASWATPIVIEAAGKTQIVTLGNPWVIAYALGDGNELWRAQWLENEVVPSPIFANGLLFLVNPSTKLMAIRPDGSGDITTAPTVWTRDNNIPDISSPVIHGEFVYTVTSGGTLTCFKAADGKKSWETNFDFGVQSSPGIMDDWMFVLGEQGPLVTVKLGREFQEVSRIPLSDKFVASPAFAGGKIFLRGLTNIYALGAAPAKFAKQP